jgi:hypothetical protein
MNSNFPKTLNTLSMFQISISIKKMSILFLFILIGLIGFAQAPQLLHYQGVARNAFGNAYSNKTMTLRLTIRTGTNTGAIVYSETRLVKTNDGGLYTVEIGSTGATGTTGSIGAINWQTGTKYLQVEADPAAGNNFIDLGTTQFLSVPYAFGAGSAATVTTNANLTGVVTSVGNQTSIANGAITSDMIGTLNKSKVGLDLVNNTSDAAKPISTATQAALGNKLNIADSSTGYVTPSQLASKTFDQTPITNSIAGKLNISDSTNGYVTPAQLATKTFDQTPITNAIAGKLNISDSTNGYVTPAQLAAKTFDQTPITNAIAGKLSIADSTNGYVTPTQLAAKTFDTTSISNRINLKANITSVNTALALKAPIASPTFSGAVSIGTTNPAPSAVLDITSTSQGLLLPRLTYAQKMAIVSPVAGLIFWCTDCGTNGEMQVYNGTAFVNMVGGVAQFSMPSISATTGVYSITSSSATSGGVISSDGGAAITARGVVWGTSTAPTIALVTKTTDGTGIGTYTSTITGLTPGVTYYVRAYSTNSVGTKYGTEISFNTALAVPTLAATITASSIGATTATSGGNITYNGGATVTVSGVVWSTTSTPTIALTTKTTDGAATGTYTSSLTGLTPGTLYYVRSYATNSVGTNYGAQINFTTLNTATISATASATSITSTSAISGATITADGGAAVTARGIVYGTSAGSSTYSVTSGTGTGTYTSSLTGLAPATTYFVRAFATNSVGTVYGTETSFTTIAVAPTLTTTAAGSITKYAASAGGTITSNGGSVITVSGICWSTTATPTTSDSKTTDGTTSGTFTSTITGLTAGTTYYVRAYATNAIGTSYGAAQSFTTLTSSTLPTVGSSYGGGVIAYIYQNGDPNYSLSNIPVLIAATSDQTSGGRVYWSNSGNLSREVYLSGANYEILGAGSSNTDAIISSYGNSGTYAAKIARDYRDGSYTDWYLPSKNELNKLYLNKLVIGSFNTVNSFYWASTESNNYVANAQNFGTGNYAADSKAWDYQVRAVRTTTLIPVAINNPVLASTTSAASITSSSAILGGNVTDEGATQVSIRGLLYGTSTGSSTFSVTAGSGAGTFTSTLTGLSQGTKYFVRSFATNVQGTGYGAEVSFTTQTTATVSVTATPTSITTTTAIGGGTISSTGGATITTSGLVWDASANPTVALSTKTTNGTTSGTFTSSITGLTQGTTYHVRAYATNSVGTSYGPNITFTTVTTPTISATATVTSITGTTATGGGTITTDGGASVTSRGLVWGTSSGASTFSVTTGTGSGTYTSSITGLSISTSYFVRAFATNSVGTVYGPEVSFATLNIPAISSTTVASSITGSSAISGGTITADGGAAVTARGLVWGTITGSSTYSVTTGTGTGTYTSSLTGLARSTTYFVRAFATNSVGTVYGPEISLTTLGVEVPILANTSAASRIGPNTASVGVTISSDGGGSIISSGVCWSTTSTPTTANSKTTDGSGSTFSSSITGLSENTTYYVRSYATNSAGTAYGSQISFSTYGTVTTRTGKIWLDRNLGASRVAQNSTDVQAYGDYFQWGRPADGHEKMQINGTTADFTYVKSTTSVPSNSKFIKTNDGSKDWLVTPDNTLWTGSNPANNPCPSGFRIPTDSEWDAERARFTSQDVGGSYETNYGLRLTIPGVANNNSLASNAWQISPGSYGQYLTQTAGSDGSVKYFGVNSSNQVWFDSNYYKNHGQSVRCIKN